MIRAVKISSLTIENNIFLAPMAGVNCPAFLLSCRKHGAGMVFTQMYDAHSLVENEVEKFIEILPGTRPVGIQLVGAKPDLMKKAAERLTPVADVIDINFGCPDADVLGNKAGAFFLKHPEQTERVVKAVIAGTSKPVTAKIRSGWDETNALKVCKMLEDYGIAAISIHGRTKVQGFSGKADWKIIKEVKEKSNIPIIGNGDIIDSFSAGKMFKITGCDAIMVGRAAMGNPLIFDDIIKGIEAKHELEEKRKAFLEFLGYYEQQKRQSFTEIRQHAIWLFKGIRQAAKIKDEIGKIGSKEKLVDYVDKLKV